jgi:Ca-activated chloride channel family protein
MFDVIDTDFHTKGYIDLWDATLDSQVMFTTIGVQADWDVKTEFFGNTRQQIFRELAYSTAGQWFHAPSEKLVKRHAETLFEQLTGPVPYRFKATWENKKKKPGTLQIVFEEGESPLAAQNVEVILDASNSMWGRVEGKSKIEIARKVLTEIIQELPSEINLGLRFYGHRYGRKDKRACTDTELVSPIGPLARKKLIKLIHNTKPKGRTPLVYSVLQSAEDFHQLGCGTIILITDGLESCEGDIKAIGPMLDKTGITLKLHIVGFDIKGAAARQELDGIAKSAGGRYFQADDAVTLLNSLSEVMKIAYIVVDENGTEVAEGFINSDAVKISEGRYTVRLMVDSQPVETSVLVRPNELTSIVVNRDAGAWIFRH